jgi:hypothetical protein
MLLEPITVNVDPEVATVYRSASQVERQKLDLLVSLRLREATRSKQSLKEIAAEISRSAQQRGLTPEILKGILDEP